MWKSKLSVVEKDMLEVQSQLLWSVGLKCMHWKIILGKIGSRGDIVEGDSMVVISWARGSSYPWIQCEA